MTSHIAYDLQTAGARTLPATNHDIALALQGVSVRYRLERDPAATLKDHFVRNLFHPRQRFTDFWALRDVDLTVFKGEAVGIVGRNGSGKSTLLKVISRILFPTRGRVQLYGRISPLLELGSGFHPELTGRENIYLNGAILGFPRAAVEARVDDIIDFAEIGQFIDSPVRTYSSGMSTRLGFAIASHVDPDILVIDEVLAVGDTAFQEKCKTRIQQFQAQGTTILLVAHAMQSIRETCSRVIWLDKGHLMQDGTPDEVTTAYLKYTTHHAS